MVDKMAGQPAHIRRAGMARQGVQASKSPLPHYLFQDTPCKTKKKFQQLFSILIQLNQSLQN
jgi:hypothetical protein